jgi:hypothetical protein
MRLLLVTIVSLVFASATPAADTPPLSPPLAAPLSAAQVVDHLTQRNQDRAALLRAYEAHRIYHLQYKGFPGDKDAEMLVEMNYETPPTKHFTVVSQSGSKLLADRVFRKLLESEQEALSAEYREGTLLSADNYEFQLVDYQRSPEGDIYTLSVEPRRKNKFLYRGKVWIDGTDFAVRKIEAEPAKSPSFWTKKTTIEHEYQKVGDFWLPLRNKSVSWIRLGGHATLTIDYLDYKIIDPGTPAR